MAVARRGGSAGRIRSRPPSHSDPSPPLTKVREGNVTTVVNVLSDVQVNLHFNCENELGEVVSWEPFAGRTAVTLKKDGRLRIRVPEFALGGELKATRAGKPCALAVSSGSTCHTKRCRPS